MKELRKQAHSHVKGAVRDAVRTAGSVVYGAYASNGQYLLFIICIISLNTIQRTETILG